MIDLHCHVLPGVDDGSPDLETSLEFLRLAASTGTTDIIATSHQHAGRYPNEPDVLRRAMDVLEDARRRAVEAGETLPRLHLGAEVHLDGDVAQDLADGRRLRLAGGPYVLLELSDAFPLPAVEDLVFRLQLAGTTTILAHPERIGQLLRHPDQLLRLVEMGALGQVTASSIAGDFGEPCRRTSQEWLEQGLLHLAGSDAHDLKRRPPRLDRARAAVEAILGAEAVERMFVDRPRAVLEGRPVEVPAPKGMVDTSPGWRERLRGLFRAR